MKLINFENFEPFNILRKMMGNAPLAEFSLNYKSQGLSKDELDMLIGRGVDVKFEDIRILEDQTLTYKNKRVLVYIRDIGDSSSRYTMHNEDNRYMPKFHVSWCRTLKEKHQNNQFKQRYVVSQRTDGKFDVIVTSQNKVKTRSIEMLRVCKNCLSHLSYEGYKTSMKEEEKDKSVADFNISDFLKKYTERFFIKPTYSNFNAPINIYSEDFSQISTKLREKAGWKCQECNIYLGNEKYPFLGEEINLRQYLHAHHINGAKYDNNDSNLKILCLKCHEEQPTHSHMKKIKGYETFLKIYDDINSRMLRE